MKLRVALTPWAALAIWCWSQQANADDYSSAIEAFAKGDYTSAFGQLRDLANDGHAHAQYKLAEMYANGYGMGEDDRVALHWYRQAAEQGVIEAQYQLALMYFLGRTVRQDHAEAAYWYRQLADDGHGPAQYLLAGMYEDGEGVPRDRSLAVFWYRRAAEQGHVSAQVKLGTLYAEGKGVPQDLVQAWVWFDLAAAKGRESAARERTKLRARLSERELAEAAELARQLNPSPATQSATPPPARGNDFAAIRQMAAIEGGCFAMGSGTEEAGHHRNEVRHRVCVNGFSISRYEVTRGEYAEFVRDTGRGTDDGCRTLRDGRWQFQTGRSWQEPGFEQSDRDPVVCVSRDDAQAYASWLSERHELSYRLPTETEWEYVARAGTSTARHWGDDTAPACLWANIGDRALQRHYPDWSWEIHRCDDGHVHTAPVGSYSANPFGLYDMVGNVWEWTCSSYDSEYRGAQLRCAESASDRGGVVRGGSWSNSPIWVRLSARFANAATERLDLVGFRLAHD